MIADAILDFWHCSSHFMKSDFQMTLKYQSKFSHKSLLGLDEICIVDDKGGSVDLNYKRKAVEYWNSGKKGRLSVSVVQNRFRKVNSH